MRACLMIEGQENVRWDDWLQLASAAEEHGFEGLFTSDHYGSVQGQANRGSFDAWAVLSALASRTQRLRLGTLVSPASFRHPSVLAKTVVTADHVSGGRVEAGMGAGWLPTEHAAYGFPFLSMGERMDVLEEQIEIVHRTWTEDEFSFSGKHYTLEKCVPLHKPLQSPHPPLIVGGLGKARSARIAARWASEYDIVSTPRAEAHPIVERLRRECETQQRDPASLAVSVMAGICIGADRRDVLDRALRIATWIGRGSDGETFLKEVDGRWFTGRVEDITQQVAELAAAGVQRVFIQMLLHEDLEAVALIGRELLPAIAAL